MSLNYSYICRLCLKQNDTLMSIFTDKNGGSSLTLPAKINSFAPELKLSAGDGLPDKVCEQCACQVDISYKFKLQCENSDAALRQSLISQSLDQEIFLTVLETGDNSDTRNLSLIKHEVKEELVDDSHAHSENSEEQRVFNEAVCDSSSDSWSDHQSEPSSSKINMKKVPKKKPVSTVQKSKVKSSKRQPDSGSKVNNIKTRKKNAKEYNADLKMEVVIILMLHECKGYDEQQDCDRIIRQLIIDSCAIIPKKRSVTSDNSHTQFNRVRTHTPTSILLGKLLNVPTSWTEELLIEEESNKYRRSPFTVQDIINICCLNEGDCSPAIISGADVVMASVFVFLLLLHIIQGKRCPDDCLCDFEVNISDCSERFLYQPPVNLDVSIETLRLQDNYLGDLTSEYFLSWHITHIKKLDLSNNLISIIHNNAFLGMQKLHELYIENNTIYYLVDDCFNGLHNLEKLFLDDNKLRFLYSDIFHELGSLKLLSLSNNKLQYIQPGTFNGLHSLIKLIVSGNYLRTLSPGLFKGAESNLEILLFNYNEITRIEDDTFSNASAVWFLSLRSNTLQVLKSGAFKGLTALEYLYLNDNTIEQIKPDTFINLPKLTSLDLSDNTLYGIHPNAFSENKNLQRLYLSRNGGLQIHSEIPLINIPSLKFLKLSGCNVAHLSETVLKNAPNLTALALDNTCLLRIDLEALQNLKELRLLSVHNNPLPCTCSLQKIRNWCLENNIDTNWYTDYMEFLTIGKNVGLEPSCIFPQHDMAMSWENLNCTTET